MATDQDNYWKEALDIYFEDAMAFFFPQIHQDINWSKGYQFLDKELLQITKDSEVGKRYADKLIKVALSDGKETWLLIHIEVQGYLDRDFEQRMFQYYYRIRDRYKEEVVSLALLTDTNVNYRSGLYRVARWGFELNFQFPTVKVLEYGQNWEALEANSNPFALIVMAHLKAQQEKRPKEQLNWKLYLIEELLKRDYSQERIAQLFRFIDWILSLPAELEQSFREEIAKIKEVENMTFVTNFERYHIQKGKEEGLAEGKQVGKQEEAASLILRQLRRRVGIIGTETQQQVNGLPLEKLEELGEALLDFTGTADLANWLRDNIPGAA